LLNNEIQDLKQAKDLLESPKVAIRIANVLGLPIEKCIECLPESWNKNLTEVTRAALMKASNAAIFTMKDKPYKKSSNNGHKVSVIISGGVGGFFGMTAIAAELPVSTTIILRSIADIARNEGESINSPDTQIACLEVFALGGKTNSDNASESGYFAVRAALAKSVTEASTFILERGVVEEAAPILVKLIVRIAAYFEVQVTEKFAVQAIPTIGMIGGAVINTVFIDHFQDMARGHFIIRRLERKYGEARIRVLYEDL
jgi:hypothetical protein